MKCEIHYGYMQAPDRVGDYEIRTLLYTREGGRCFYCRHHLRDDWIIEHVYPRRYGGADALCNFVAACRSCNTRKGSKILANVDEIQRWLSDWEAAYWADLYEPDDG